MSKTLQLQINNIKSKYKAGLAAKQANIALHWLNFDSDPSARQECQRLIHNLAGSAGSYDFQRLSLAAKELDLLFNSQPEQASCYYDQAYQQLQQAFAQEIPTGFA